MFIYPAPYPPAYLHDAPVTGHLEPPRAQRLHHLPAAVELPVPEDGGRLWEVPGSLKTNIVFNVNFKMGVCQAFNFIKHSSQKITRQNP